MPTYAQTPKTSYTPTPEGTYHGTLVKIVDLGIQDNVSWEAKPRVRFVWELDKTDLKTGKPYQVSEFFNNSLFKSKKATSKLRERVEGLLGRDLTADETEPEGFDLENLIDTEATLTVSHEDGENGKVWARITSVERDHVPF